MPKLTLRLSIPQFAGLLVAVVAVGGLRVTAALHAGEGEQAAAKLPLLVHEDFEKGADAWQPTDPAAWKLEKADGNTVYSQFQRRSKYDPPHRSPYNIALLKDVVVGDFVLTGGGPAVTDSVGVPWSGSFVNANGDLTVDLRSDIAAESRAKIVYEYLMKFTDDPGVRDTLGFLMTREIAHFQMFQAALDTIQPNFPPGVLQGDPRFTHASYNLSDGEAVRGPWNQGQGPWEAGLLARTAGHKNRTPLSLDLGGGRERRVTSARRSGRTGRPGQTTQTYSGAAFSPAGVGSSSPSAHVPQRGRQAGAW